MAVLIFFLLGLFYGVGLGQLIPPPGTNRLTKESSQIFSGGLCPYDYFCYCGVDAKGKLETICSNGGLTYIPFDHISNHIQVIRIRGNRETGVGNRLSLNRSLRLFKNLEILEITDSGLTTLGPTRNFLGLQSLQSLNLTSNRLRELYQEDFTGLKNLKILILRKNEINSLPSKVFELLPNLKELDLSENNLRTLNDKVFYNLHLLQSLDLSHNRFDTSKFRWDVLRDAWRVNVFRCSRCNIHGRIPFNVASLIPKVEALDLSDNDINFIPSGYFKDLTNLSFIDLSRNRNLKNLNEESLGNLKNVTTLNVSNCGLEFIHHDAFRNSNVTSIDLSGNKLTFFDRRTFAGYTGQSILSMNLSKNRQIAPASLLVLLSDLPNLQELDLSYTDLGPELPFDLFEDTHNLTNLNISHNRLNELQPTWFIPFSESIQFIDLSFNALRGINAETLNVFRSLPRIRELWLDSNPWACDLCHAIDLIEFVKIHSLFTKACEFDIGPNCLVCASPYSLRYTPLLKLQYSDLDWCDPDGHGGLSTPALVGMTTALLLALALTSGLLFYFHMKFRHTAVYYTNEDSKKSIVSSGEFRNSPSELNFFGDNNSIGFIAGTCGTPENAPRYATVHHGATPAAKSTYLYPDVVA